MTGQPGGTTEKQRWIPSTKLVGYVGAIGAITSVVALTIAIIALNSSVQQQAARGRADAQQAAYVAAANAAKQAAVDAACQIYAFNIGEPGDPPPSTPRGRTLAQRAKERSTQLGCRPLTAAPSVYVIPIVPPVVITPAARSTK